MDDSSRASSATSTPLDMQEPPQLPENNPPDLQEEQPQLPEISPPVVQVEASSDETQAVSTDTPPIVADSPPPPLPDAQDLAGSPEPAPPQPAPDLESPKASGKKTPPSPKRLIPTPPPPPYKAVQSASAATSQPKPHVPFPAPVPEERRQEGEIYEVEVRKGLLGLGIKIDTNESGLVVVKSLSSSSPLTKDGTMRSIISLYNAYMYICVLCTD